MSDERLTADPDFILLKRFGYSIQKLEQRYPDGCPAHIIAPALGLTEEELVAKHEEIVVKLRALMGA